MTEPDDFDAPDYLDRYPVWAWSSAEQEDWRIEGISRTVEEEMADEEEDAMQRGWRQ